jgi:hypothetical protein
MAMPCIRIEEALKSAVLSSRTRFISASLHVTSKNFCPALLEMACTRFPVGSLCAGCPAEHKTLENFASQWYSFTHERMKPKHRRYSI